ncbi:hypothetical protein CHL76_11670 [Marinococcus halophilus]|uniref:5,10-methylene-tetrahydrofolate dehydrogenase n=1 Tax=Marinococcus halophilus TaxID=1371 RepID=A0A510Y9L4_MARHA|nr:YIP1 family protein [Marinococcus halophilus]OZT79570.1 hypothetical protein CHL76_11670 [Marinococcus halophilus]GEK60074.1 hypothetical protein MHA01_29790 [Marinococcus halophilus]
MLQPTKKLGLITAPGYAAKLGEALQRDLPPLLARDVDEEYSWQIECTEDLLTGETNDSLEVLEALEATNVHNKWDFVIALTDLPLFQEKKTILAEMAEDKNSAFISLPGLGFMPMYKRVREAVLQLVNEMYYGSSDQARAYVEKRNQLKKGPSLNSKNQSSTRLMSKRLLEILSPITRETLNDPASKVRVRYMVKNRSSGRWRIFSGMVRANRPWDMFPAFIKVVVVAFTTGAYALVFPTLWQLSHEYNAWRMLMLSVVSILAMVSWIILAHRLWEQKAKDKPEYIRKLYNTTTFVTLCWTVTMFYILLFLLFSAAVMILIPIGMLEAQLSGTVGYLNYFYVAWTATSVATIVGALGSVFEEKEMILESTYGYRQRWRHERIKRFNEEQKQEEQAKKEAVEKKHQDSKAKKGTEKN